MATTEKYSAPKISAIGKVNNTEREIFIEFTWKHDHTDKFDIDWEYTVGRIDDDGYNVWFVGQRSKVDPESLGGGLYRYTWEAPENAVAVKVQVKPVSTTRSVSGDQTAWWTSGWSNVAKYQLQDHVKDAPEISASINGASTEITVKVSKMASGFFVSRRWLQIQRAVDSSSGELWWDKWVTDGKDMKTNAPTSKTYTSGAVSDGHTYWFRARWCVNRPAGTGMTNGWSPWTEWVKVMSRAAQPRNVVAKAVAGSADEGGAATSVRLRWDHSGTCDSYVIEYSSNKDAWSQGAEGDIEKVEGVEQKTYTVTGLEAGKTYWFRVWAKGMEYDDKRQKDSKYSSNTASCTVGTAPSAPTVYDAPAALTIGQDATLRWTHNCEDGCTAKASQVAVGVNYRSMQSYGWYREVDAGGSTSMQLLATGVLEHLADGDEVKWWARTQAVSGQWSPWSGARAIRVWEDPAVSITLSQATGSVSEENPLTSFPLTIAVSESAAAQAIASSTVFVVALEDYTRSGADGEDEQVLAGDTVFSRTLDGADAYGPVEVSASDGALVAGVAYEVRAACYMSSGLQAHASSRFTCSWDEEPLSPMASVYVREGSLSAAVDVWAEDADGERAACDLSVYRIGQDGDPVLLAAGLAGEDMPAVQDPHPPFCAYRYRVVATDRATGVQSAADFAAELSCSQLVVQWGGAGESWSEWDERWRPSENEVRLPYNVQVSWQTAPDVSLREYEGRTHPVAYYGTQRREEGSWSADLVRGEDDDVLSRLKLLQAWRGDCYVREPSGMGYWANVQVSMGHGYDTDAVSVSLSVKRVEGGA